VYELSEKKKILYVQTRGIDEPERAYAPFLLSSTARAMGIDAIVYFLIDGITILKKGEAEKIKLSNFPVLKHVIDQAAEAGVKLLICEQSCMMLEIEKNQFLPYAKIVGATTLNDLILEADAVLSF
jgi:predicted peroxiredoxin